MEKYVLTFIILLTLIGFASVPTDINQIPEARIEPVEELPAAKLGTVIRDARQKMNFSEDDLAKELGVSVENIQKIEQGKAIPTQALIFKLEKMLNCTLVMDI